MYLKSVLVLLAIFSIKEITSCTTQKSVNEFYLLTEALLFPEGKKCCESNGYVPQFTNHWQEIRGVQFPLLKIGEGMIIWNFWYQQPTIELSILGFKLNYSKAEPKCSAIFFFGNKIFPSWKCTVDPAQLLCVKPY